jgi:hypothetical protein
MAAFPPSTQATSTRTKRIIYFQGHREAPRSALICQLAAGYESISALLPHVSPTPGSGGGGEGATRTLLNLYNLHAVRGLLEEEGEGGGGVSSPRARTLEFRTSMTGPHHYFGWIDPRAWYVIEEAPREAGGGGTGAFADVNLLRYRRVTVDASHPLPPRVPLRPVPAVLTLRDYDWLAGR